jgi:hypothetical protein
VTDLYTQGMMEDFDRRESGQAFDIEIDQFGVPRYVGTQEMFQGAEDQPNLPASMTRNASLTRRERRGQEPTITTEEALQLFSKTMSGALTGLLPGAVAGSVGAPGDIIGLFAGAYEAATAEEGERINAFLQTLTDISGQYGSERALEFGRNIVEDLPVSEQVKEGMRGGLQAGSFVGVPVGVTQVAKTGLAAFKALTKPGTPPAMAPRVPGAGMIDVETEAVKNMLPFESIPKRTNISEMERDEWQQLSSELKISQPIITPGDAVDAAQRNQKMLAKAGPEIAAATGASFKNPGIKGADDRGKRMAEKAKQKGGIQQLTDVTRAGFSVQSTKTADEIVDLLEQRPEFKIIDEGYNVTPQGYFDRKILVVNPDGQVGEVQIAPNEVWRAKYEQGGEALYGIARSEASTPAQAAKAVADSVELYSAAINRLDDDFVEIARGQLQSIVAKGGKDAEQAKMVLDKLRAAQ